MVIVCAVRTDCSFLRLQLNSVSMFHPVLHVTPACAVSCEGSSPQYPDHGLRGRHSSHPHLYYASVERQDAPALGLDSRLAYPALQTILPPEGSGTPPVHPVCGARERQDSVVTADYIHGVLRFAPAPFSRTVFSSESESLATADSPHLRQQDVPLSTPTSGPRYRAAYSYTAPPILCPYQRLLPRRRRSEPLGSSLNCSRIRFPGPRIRV